MNVVIYFFKELKMTNSMSRLLRLLLVAAAFGVAGAGVMAQDTIYGSQLMTEAERVEHRAKLRNLKTVQERETYQAEHHQRMQDRAREKGVTLPESPPAAGKGMGGGGMGSGMGGMGGGMGGGPGGGKK